MVIYSEMTCGKERDIHCLFLKKKRGFIRKSSSAKEAREAYAIERCILGKRKFSGNITIEQLPKT